MQDVKVKLIHIPQYHYKVPVKLLPYGVGVLSAFLKDHHYNVVSEDIGIKIDQHNEKSWFAPIDLSIVRREKEILDYASGRTKSKRIEKFADQVGGVTDLKNYDLIGISIQAYPQFIFALVLSRKIKFISNAKVVLGGSFITLNGKNFSQQFRDIDYMVIGDGQVPLLKLIEHLEGKIPIASVPSLLYRENGTIKENPREFFPIDDICVPDFSDLAFDSYLSIFGDKVPLSYQTSRGCRNSCSFCKREGLNPSIEFKSYDKTVSELRTMKERYHSNMFWLYDDCINASYEYLDKLCDRLIQEDLDINLAGSSVRADNLDRTILRKMRKAGCSSLCFGIESGSDRILKSMGKGFNTEQASRVLKDSYEAGINNIIDIMVGYPQEKEEDIIETEKFIRKNAGYIHTIYLFILRVEQGSHLYDNPERFGIRNLRPIFDTSRELDFYHFAFDEIGGLKWEEKTKQAKHFKKRILKANFKYILSKRSRLKFIPFWIYYFLTEWVDLFSNVWFVHNYLKKRASFILK